MAITLSGASAVIIDDGKYNNNAGFEQLPNGTLTHVYRSGTTHTSGDGAIKQQYSTDGGVTWGAQTEIIASVSDEYRDPEILLLANGTILITYTEIVSPGSDVYVAIGTIAGSVVTWGSRILARANAGCNARPIQLPDGTIILPIFVANSVNSATLSSAAIFSTDNGLTWGGFVIVAEDPAGVIMYSEWEIVRPSNGHLVGIIRNDTTLNWDRVLSTDDGATWPTFTADVINNSGEEVDKPTLCLLPNDDIFIMTRRPGLNTAGRAGWSYSSDEGVNWAAFTHWEGDDALQSYQQSSAAMLQNGKMGVTIARQYDTPYCKVHYQEFNVSGVAFTESFDKADSTVLGPDLTWNELEGNFSIVSNCAIAVFADGLSLARAEHDLTTIDHYVEAIINNIESGGTDYVGLLARQDSGATTSATGTFYQARFRYSSIGDVIQIFRDVASVEEALAEVAFALTTNTQYLFRFEVTGTNPVNLRIRIDGVERVNVNDSGASRIVAGVRTGILALADASATIKFIEFEAGDLTQVATPAISPDGGSFVVATEVTLTCATGGADIYYTTDGSTPDDTKTLYTVPFTLLADATVKAIGIQAGLTDSAVASAVFDIEIPAPASDTIDRGRRSRR